MSYTYLKYIFLGILSALLFFQCNSTDEEPTPVPAVCTKDLKIDQVCPDNNPGVAPVQIEGKGFTAETQVFFNNFLAVVDHVDENTITTHVPGALLGSAATVDLKVKEGACGDSTAFDVTPGFLFPNAPNPPDIIIPQNMVSTCLKDSMQLYKDIFGQAYILQNTWIFQGEHSLTFDNYELEFPGGNGCEEVKFTGTEYFGSVDARMNFTAFYQATTNVITFVMERNNVPGVPPFDILEGSFYNMELSTPNGKRNGTFMLLNSQTTCRQYLFDLHMK